MIHAFARSARTLVSGAAAALMLAVPSPLLGAPGGPIGTLPLGRYVCELPGDALGPAGIARPEFHFEVKNASSYGTDRGTGIYLLTGDRLAFTSGPLRGLRYHRVGAGFLRRTQPDGTDGPLRCVRENSTNVIGQPLEQAADRD